MCPLESCSVENNWQPFYPVPSEKQSFPLSHSPKERSAEFVTDASKASKGTHLILSHPGDYFVDRSWGLRRILHVLENLEEKGFNKYIRIIYNWHTLCLNANTAVKVVLKNSLLAFSPHRRNIPLVYTTHLPSKPLFILGCKAESAQHQILN